jgi:ribulose-phosphate 3-epimerase
MKIYPSLISADLLNLEKTLQTLDPYCDGYHLDIMDNHFVPNLTWGNAFIKAIEQATKLPLDVHFMVERPEAWLETLTLRPKDVVTFHPESSALSPFQVIKQTEKKGWLAGIALSPKIEVGKIEHLLPDVHQVTVMTVEPGFSGQKFMPTMMPKIQHLAQIRKEKNLDFILAVDGGVNKENIAELATCGVDEIAAAGAIFFGKDPVKAIEELRAAASRSTQSPLSRSS